MPDYDLSNGNQVRVKIYGKILDERYTYILFNHPDLDLETVYLLDKIRCKKTDLSEKSTQKQGKKNRDGGIQTEN